MSILDQANHLIEIASFEAGSSETEIARLKDFSPVDLPDDYLGIISEKTEVEIGLKNSMYIRIWSAEGCIEMNEAYQIQSYLPDALAFADDENCNVFLFTTGKNGKGIYRVSLSDLEIEEMVYIADSLSDFFIKGIGMDTVINVFLE